MSPTMAPVSTSPFTFFQLLRSQQLLLLLVLGLLTGTVNVPTLLSSTSLAHFNNRLSRAESLFTIFAFHTHTTTYYGFNFACIVHNVATMMTIILAVPTSVCPPPRDHCVPGRAGGSQKAGGPVEMAHLASKQTRTRRALVLPLLLTHFHTHFNSQFSICWTDWFGSIRWCHCGRWFCRLFLLAISIHLPLPTRDQGQDAPREKFSLSEVCARNLDRREWRKMSQLESMGLTVATLPIICPFRLYRGFGFQFWHRTGSLHATYLLDFHFRQRTASFTAMPRLDVYWVCLTCSPFVESAFFIGLFTTSLSCVAASFARQT